MSDTPYTFVQVNEFTPADGHWTSIGQIADWSYNSNEKSFLLTAANNSVSVKIYILGPAAFQVRFNPLSSDYSTNYSYAVVNRNLGETKVQYQKTEFNGHPTLEVVLDKITLRIGLDPYGIAVYRGFQVINQDTYGYNLVYKPGTEYTACLKSVIPGAGYYGFGEKAGVDLDKNGSTMTFFNYDNFQYSRGSNQQPKKITDPYPVIPPDTEPGPLNVSEPLYNSMPVLVEWNPTPPKTEYFAGSPYACLVFLDNPGQAYYNIQNQDYSQNMDGRYYFGALYGEMSYYFMAGDDVAEALKQYITLTGSFSESSKALRPAMPPMYALGFQQGCYGYYDRGRLLAAAYGYRANQFPIDGLHIDVDFQDNYRTFTVSNLKFPNVSQMFEALHENGFKCSTNITGIITTNPTDDTGQVRPYEDLESGYSQDVFVRNEFAPPLSSLELQALAAIECTKDAKENPEKAEKCIANNPPLAERYAKYVEEHAGLDKVEALQKFAINVQYFVANENYGCNLGFNPYPSPNPPDNPDPCKGGTPLGTIGHYPDIGKESTKEWWGQQYKYLIESGLDMIWQDMTCPAVVRSVNGYAHYDTLPLNIMMTYLDGKKQPNATFHNAFAINLVEATYKGLTKVKEQLPEGHYNKDKRNFIVTRGGYAGVHRYAANWTGDSGSSWDFLKINIPEVLNWGMSGQPFSGCDIGGFGNGDAPGGKVLRAGVIQGGEPSPELLTRWMTMGAFLPWYRNHYDGYTKAFQEPYNYVQAYPDKGLGYKVLDACRKYVRIRYQLLQLFYDGLYEWTQTGLPLCRALFLNDPHDANLYGPHKARLNDQFFVGHDLLVAPIVEKAPEDKNYLADREVYLPEGSDWYIYTNNAEPLGPPSKGGRGYQWREVDLDVVPLYVRAGAIIPMRELEEWVGQLKENPITYTIYPGPDSDYVCYQDDGITTNAELKGEYRITKVAHKAISNDEQEVTIVRDYDSAYTPSANFYFVSFLGRYVPSSVTANGDHLSEIQGSDDNKNAKALAASSVNAYYYNYSLQTTFVKLFDEMSPMTLRVSF
ncbi:MAG: DUF5110 domain-containing protein [Sphaerospermopsis sp. SIO1G2]|nr:DUF5110 domain-containing protein [Sphaerospermopsis sp. SIO1G2]